MSLHSLLVWLPAPLLMLALLLDVLDGTAPGDEEIPPPEGGESRIPGGGIGRRGAKLVAVSVGIVALAAFTGLGARRRLPASVPGSPMPPWDVHVNWAVVLLIPILALGFIRVRAVGARWTKTPVRLVVLDLALLVLVSVVLYTGLRIP